MFCVSGNTKNNFDMRKFYFLLLTVLSLAACSDDDEAGFVRTPELEAGIERLNADVLQFKKFDAAVSELQLSDAVVAEENIRLTFDDGSVVVVPQKAAAESFVTLATAESGERCWAVRTASGVVMLTDGEGRTCGVSKDKIPHFDIDKSGFWTVNFSVALSSEEQAVRILDAQGQPVEAKGNEMCAIIRTAMVGDGEVKVTFDDGSVVSLQLSKFVSLSEGGTSNCYVVSQPGDYRFTATVRGNGMETSGVTATIEEKESLTADWLWCDKEGLLSDVKYSKGYISFTAAEQKGNAVVALFDGDKVVWSWHIWFTDTPEEVTYPNGTVFLDRNLGAVGITANGTDAYGLYYQWGRKDPFYGGATTETSADAFKLARENTIVNPRYASLDWLMVKDHGATLDEAAAAPTSFFSYTGREGRDWQVQPSKNDLWGERKTMYDPCPKGYRIPDVEDWCDLEKGNRYVSGVSRWDADTDRMVCTFGGVETWYPAQGSRNAANGNLVGLGKTRTGNYWACGNQAGKAEFLYFKKPISSSSGEINRSLVAERALGYNVRCVKEK